MLTQLPRVTPNVMLSLEPESDQIPYRLSSLPAPMLSSPAPPLSSSAPAVALMLTSVESNTNRRLNTSIKPPTLPKTRKHTNPSPPPDVDLMALCKNGSIKETIELMSQGVPAGSDVFELVLDSCDDLELGKKVQQLLIRSPYYGFVNLNSKLIVLYIKCNNMRDACRVFDRMHERDNLSL
ncbi:unnamed protein product [Lactuca virosa]|uniref:Pentatricopeptide repeat-containing protein n=1 Tax=Lactuca virosa TaxID=75947 RepID=A0AAU9MBW1_9ASTR|nr:unnamed protein product [Lactuca virosa]